MIEILYGIEQYLKDKNYKVTIPQPHVAWAGSNMACGSKEGGQIFCWYSLIIRHLSNPSISFGITLNNNTTIITKCEINKTAQYGSNINDFELDITDPEFFDNLDKILHDELTSSTPKL